MDLGESGTPISSLMLPLLIPHCILFNCFQYFHRMVVKIFPASQTSVLEEESELGDPLLDSPQNSWEDVYCQFDVKEPSPFSSKKVMYESEQVGYLQPSYFTSP